MSGLFLVTMALGLSNLAGSAAIGLGGVDASLRLRVAVVFDAFDAGMPLLGLLLGHRVAGPIGGAAPWAGGSLLMATGDVTHVRPRVAGGGAAPAPTTAALLATGAALSVDNLVVGFARGPHRVPLVAACAVIAVVSVAMSLVGHEAAHRLGRTVCRHAAGAGSAVFVAVGALVLTGVL